MSPTGIDGEVDDDWPSLNSSPVMAADEAADCEIMNADLAHHERS